MELDIEEGSSMGMDLDMDFADDLSVPSDNSHFTRTECNVKQEWL
jgi:hypothetical protein